MPNMTYPSGQLPATQPLLAPTCHQQKSDTLVSFAIAVVPLATYIKATIHYKVRYQGQYRPFLLVCPCPTILTPQDHYLQASHCLCQPVTDKDQICSYNSLSQRCLWPYNTGLLSIIWLVTNQDLCYSYRVDQCLQSRYALICCTC